MGGSGAELRLAGDSYRLLAGGIVCTLRGPGSTRATCFTPVLFYWQTGLPVGSVGDTGTVENRSFGVTVDVRDGCSPLSANTVTQVTTLSFIARTIKGCSYKAFAKQVHWVHTYGLDGFRTRQAPQPLLRTYGTKQDIWILHQGDKSSSAPRTSDGHNHTHTQFTQRIPTTGLPHGGARDTTHV